MKIIKMLSVVLAAVIAVSALAMLSGCGKGDTAATAAPTVKPTVAATVAATDAAQDKTQNNAQNNAQNNDAGNQSQQNNAQAETSPVDADGYIDQQTAIANVKQQAGSGAQIISCEKGTSPDGAPCYVVVVAPVTASEEATTVTYYSGYLFCYAEDAASNADPDVYIDEQTAIANVKQQAGSGAQIISCEKGTSPDGAACYVVVVAPITASEEAVYDTYYSGYQFCYKASSDNSAE